MLDPKQRLNSFKKKKQDDPSMALLSLAHEFKIGYNELLEMPISALEVYFEYMDKLNEETKKTLKKK